MNLLSFRKAKIALISILLIVISQSVQAETYVCSYEGNKLGTVDGGPIVEGSHFCIVGNTCYYTDSIMVGYTLPIDTKVDPNHTVTETTYTCSDNIVGIHNYNGINFDYIISVTVRSYNDGIGETPSSSGSTGGGGTSYNLPETPDWKTYSSYASYEFPQINQRKSIPRSFQFNVDYTSSSTIIYHFVSVSKPTLSLKITDPSSNTYTDSNSPLPWQKIGGTYSIDAIASQSMTLPFANRSSSVTGTGNSVSAPSTTTEIGDQYIATIGEGAYTVSFAYTDYLNNSATASCVFRYDCSAPLFDSATPQVLITPTLTSNGQTGETLTYNVTWAAATDQFSGLDSYSVDEPKGTIAPTPVTSTGAAYTQIYDSSPRDVSSLSIEPVTVTATDKVGNSSNIYGGYAIPGQICLLAPTATLVSDSSSTPYPETKVTIPLDVRQPYFTKNYTQLVINRTGVTKRASGDVGIPDESIEIDINSDGSITVNNSNCSTTTDSSGNLCLVDKIPPIDGTGGESISYSITSETLVFHQYAKTGDSSFTEAGNVQLQEINYWDTTKHSAILPTHQGQMAFQMVDSDGNVMELQSGMTIESADGLINLRLQGTGYDQDDWTIAVTNLIYKQYNDVTMTATEYIKNGVAYPYVNSPSNTELYSAQTYNGEPLNFGTNYFQICWTQKANQTTQSEDSSTPPAVYYSQIICLKFVQLLSDGKYEYTFSVLSPGSSAVERDSSGDVIVSPGQLLKLDLGSDNGQDLSTVSWDFGDETGSIIVPTGTTGQTGPSAQHIYHQSIGQTSDSITRVLKLGLINSTIPINFIVRDTQNAFLYESEIWNGAHTIVGNILVPPGMTLTIGTLSDVKTTVNYTSGLAASVGQGISVQGSLYVGTKSAIDMNVSGANVIFQQDPSMPSATGQNWGTILVSGSGGASANAKINNASINGADRGVTAGASSNVSLSGVTFDSNSIAVHVLTGSSVNIQGCLISNSKQYGVKEDSGRPVMQSNIFTGNTVDYYETGITGISVAEINKLSSSNSGNLEK